MRIVLAEGSALESAQARAASIYIAVSETVGNGLDVLSTVTALTEAGLKKTGRSAIEMEVLAFIRLARRFVYQAAL